MGFMLAALILSTGQLKMKWVLIVVGVYMWIMMGSIASFFASIPARIRHIIVQ
jgi:protein involved in temperature-dependent protein secretion